MVNLMFRSIQGVRTRLHRKHPARFRTASARVGGANAVGRGPATLSDVARLARVSRWVAGHVLNGGCGNTRVGVKAAERIRKVARKLTYRPNPAACLLRGKRSYTYGLLVDSAGDPLRSFLVQYLDEETCKVGCRILIANTVVAEGRFQEGIEDFARRRVDGVLCLKHRLSATERTNLLARHPRTVFYEDAEENQPGVTVTVDHEEAARLAVRHLAERGRRRIALAMMSKGRPRDLARVRGYERELGALKRPVDPKLIFQVEVTDSSFPWGMAPDVSVATVDRVIDELVRGQRADAIVVQNDFWASVLLKRFRAQGIFVPRDVAVVGYLNHYLSEWTDPALTTIDLQHHEAARHLVDLLERLIQRDEVPAELRTVRVKPQLIVREST